MADQVHAGVIGAVKRAAPPAPVESEIGKLVAQIMAGATVVVIGVGPTARPRRYRLQKDGDRLSVTFRSDRPAGTTWAVNNDEWDVIRFRPLAAGDRLLEQRARAMLAAIFAGIPVCDFNCGKTINSGIGLGIVPI